MSVINKMLQDLDQRNAPPGTGYGRSAAIAQQLRPVRRGGVSEWFWYVMALLMLCAVAWIAWLVWQLNPRPVVTDLALQPRTEAPAAPQKVAAPANPKSPVDAQTAANLVPAAPPAVQSANPAPGAAKIDVLKLATELGTPIAQKPRARAAEPRKTTRTGPDTRTLASLKARSELDPAPGKIDRRASDPARDRAVMEFRRAVNLVNQGRLAEGLDVLRGALKLDPTYVAVRQTLVALLLESKKIDEAAAVLNAGLDIDPSNTAFAILLARVQVERHDVNGALALLQKYAQAGENVPEYHAFAAALYQRLDRHGDAVAEYETALKLSPNAGVWWVGLGISQQALNRPKEAADAFQRAKASGTLAPELAVFTDQRLKLLQ